MIRRKGLFCQRQLDSLGGDFLAQYGECMDAKSEKGLFAQDCAMTFASKRARTKLSSEPWTVLCLPKIAIQQLHMHLLLVINL